MDYSLVHQLVTESIDELGMHTKLPDFPLMHQYSNRKLRYYIKKEKMNFLKSAAASDFEVIEIENGDPLLAEYPSMPCDEPEGLPKSIRDYVKLKIKQDPSLSIGKIHSECLKEYPPYEEDLNVGSLYISYRNLYKLDLICSVCDKIYKLEKPIKADETTNKIFMNINELIKRFEKDIFSPIINDNEMIEEEDRKIFQHVFEHYRNICIKQNNVKSGVFPIYIFLFCKAHLKNDTLTIKKENHDKTEKRKGLTPKDFKRFLKLDGLKPLGQIHNNTKSSEDRLQYISKIFFFYGLFCDYFINERKQAKTTSHAFIYSFWNLLRYDEFIKIAILNYHNPLKEEIDIEKFSFWKSSDLSFPKNFCGYFLWIGKNKSWTQEFVNEYNKCLDESADLVYKDIFLKMNKKIKDINNEIELNNYRLEKIKRKSPMQDPSNEAKGKFMQLKEVIPIGDILDSLFHYMEKMNIGIYYEDVDLAFMRHIHRYINYRYYNQQLTQAEFICAYDTMCFIKSIEKKDIKSAKRAYEAMCKIKTSMRKTPIWE